MKRLLIIFLILGLFASSAYAQLGDILKKIENNPLIAQQNTIRETISRINNIKSSFLKMPLNSGKLDFIAAALPMLNQAQSLSSDILALVRKDKTLQPAQTDKMSGLLGEVEKMIAQKWNASPLSKLEMPAAVKKAQQLNSVISNILKNQGDALKGLLQGIK